MASGLFAFVAFVAMRRARVDCPASDAAEVAQPKRRRSRCRAARYRTRR
jgi:hypothetical protein